jgi:hypothetical protein
MRALTFIALTAVFLVLGITASSITGSEVFLYVFAVPSVTCLLLAFYFDHREERGRR